MPKVPTYEPGQVSSRTVTARQNINISDDAFGGNIARAQINRGQAISQLGDTMFDHALKIRDEYDKGVMREMDNNYSGYIRDKWGAFSQLQGRAALDAKQPYEDDITAYREKLSKDLDPRLNNTFNAMADVRTNNAFNRVSTHVTSQIKTYNKAQRLARIDSQIDDMVANTHDLVAVQAAKNVGIIEINDQLKDMGIDVNNPKDDGERGIIKQAVLGFTSKGHIQVIKNLEVDTPSKALEYYEKYKKEIDPESWGVLEAMLKEGTDKKKSQRLADEIMADSKNDSYQKQLEVARDIEDASLRDLVVTRINNQQADNIKNTKRVEDDAYKQAVQHFLDGGTKANMPTGVWAAMHPDKQVSLNKEIKAALKLALSLTSVNPRAGKAEFYRLQNMAHNNYEEFKKENLVRFIGIMSETDLDNLMELQKSHTAVESSLSRKEQLEMVLGSLGKDLANFDKSGGSGDAIRSFVRRVDTKVAAFVETNNRKPDDQEYQKILLDIRANEAYWDGWGVDKKMPVALMTEDELETAYVKVDGEDIYLKEITDVRRSEVMTYIKDIGAKQTAQNIAELSLLNQEKLDKVLTTLRAVEKNELIEKSITYFVAKNKRQPTYSELKTIKSNAIPTLKYTVDQIKDIYKNAPLTKSEVLNNEPVVTKTEQINNSIASLKEELSFIDKYQASNIYVDSLDGSEDLIYEGSNLSEAAMDADINNTNPDADSSELAGFEIRDKFYEERKQLILETIMKLEDSL
jgi:hypothetical protein